AGIDRHVRERLGVSAVLTLVDLILAGQVLGGHALGTRVHRHHHDVGVAIGGLDQAPGGRVVVERAGVRVAGDADEGHGQPVHAQVGDLMRAAGVGEAVAVERSYRVVQAGLPEVEGV